MSKNEIKMILFIVFLILGVMLSVQSRSIIKNLKDKPTAVSKMEGLKSELEKEKEEGQSLKELINEGMKKKEEYLRTFVNDKKDDELKTEWEHTKLKAGLTDVTGPGIIVSLNDALTKGENVRLSIIHDSDLFFIMNELKKAGAQAISINDERIISTTEIVCSGPTTRINKNRYPAPFEIKVIGDIENLYNSIVSSKIIEDLKRDGIRISINKKDQLLIKKYIDSTSKLTNGMEVVYK